ncbi:MAG TPA: energy transducer TonB [Candidatus Polarisedimenticolaceae bacterium]|nr:energy transducer TonB [Candidatus Polarisedimenticolaceae bacterium]
MKRLPATLIVVGLLAAFGVGSAQQPAAEPELQPPRIVAKSQVPPDYPPSAFRARIEGTVTLKVTVLASSAIANVEVVDCSRTGVGFEQAAVQAVKKWKFEPAMKGNQPITDALTFRLNFKVTPEGGEARVTTGGLPPPSRDSSGSKPR